MAEIMNTIADYTYRPAMHRPKTSAAIGVALTAIAAAYFTGNLNSAGFSKLSGAIMPTINKVVDLAKNNKGVTAGIAGAVVLVIGGAYHFGYIGGKSVEKTAEEKALDAANKAVVGHKATEAEVKKLEKAADEAKEAVPTDLSETDYAEKKAASDEANENAREARLEYDQKLVELNQEVADAQKAVAEANKLKT